MQQQQAQAPRCKRWGSCFGGLSCFRKQKGGKRIVPASRMPEGGNANSNHPNGPQPGGGLPNQIIQTGLNPSLYAPPSSPVSFSNSALPSTAQSPRNFLSANSPGPSSTMFVTGPYAHETQLVSPPVFSTYTTEPSTAPLTPPPELAHLTTPSSPDVPYARFLSSNMKGTGKADNYISATDLQSTYSLYPGSPASALRSPVSSQEPTAAYAKSNSDQASKLGQDSNFFCPETFAQFYLDQSSFSHSGGRLSISRETDAYSNGHQNRQNKTIKPDAEELEAYRASFGFSADEIITTAQYVEISDVLDDSFTLASSKSVGNEHILTAPSKEGVEKAKRREGIPSPELGGVRDLYKTLEDQVPHKRVGDVSGRSLPSMQIPSDDDEDLFSKMEAPRISKKSNFSSSSSDAEIEYRRGRSLREERNRRNN
ncbi:hypothetical protein CASFOL_000952 [Castilleja foliolosa]|uniref:Hydroxyproline-rich glycoprotein family protein n=1 Tax=Castilleja foliolosa TaxID=1961234 RepID=A0ABD3EPG2_9LAMI